MAPGSPPCTPEPRRSGPQSRPATSVLFNKVISPYCLLMICPRHWRCGGSCRVWRRQRLGWSVSNCRTFRRHIVIDEADLCQVIDVLFSLQDVPGTAPADVAIAALSKVTERISTAHASSTRKDNSGKNQRCRKSLVNHFYFYFILGGSS